MRGDAVTKKQAKWQTNYGLLAHCDRDNVHFSSIYQNRFQVEMCCGNGPLEKETIQKLRVREAEDDEETCYWGWLESPDSLLDIKGGDIVFIRSSKVQFEMCFIYGYQVEEERGKGRAIRVIVEELVV